MAPTPLISIITPVFNGEKYIAETVDSVLNASINIPFEYLVLNDGSQDTTLAILESYGDKIQTISHENMGESATVNSGLENARGKYILVISADDPLLTGELVDKAIQILEGEPLVVALYPDWKIIDEYGNTLKVKILPEYSDEIMIGRCRCLPGPGVVFRKDAAIKIGGRRAKWKYVGDYDFWLRLSRVGRIQRLPGVLAQWRDNEDSTSISQRGQAMALDRIQVMEDFISEHDIPLNLSRKAIANAYCVAARLAFFDSTVEGRTLLFKAIKHRHGWPEEARIHIVLYLLLTPISTFLLKQFPSITARIVRY
jgi:glycosyltransferase involved in cell wall biosynthesis